MPLKSPNSPCRAQTRQLSRFNRREKQRQLTMPLLKTVPAAVIEHHTKSIPDTVKFFLLIYHCTYTITVSLLLQFQPADGVKKGKQNRNRGNEPDENSPQGSQGQHMHRSIMRLIILEPGQEAEKVNIGKIG